MRFQLISRTIALGSFFLLGCLLVVSTANGEDEPTAAEAVPGLAITTIDPAVPLNDLTLMLRPMTTNELSTEANGWFDLLKQKVQEISDVELASRKQKLGSPERILALESERDNIIKRLEEVMSEQERKGADVAAMTLYVDAVSGVDLGVDDTSRLVMKAWSWLKSPEGGINWLINLLKFVGILVVTTWIVSLLASKLDNVLLKSGKVSVLIRQFSVTMVRRGGLVIGVLLGLTAIQVSLGPIFAVVGAASFVLAFALQSNLANLASGMMLMIGRPFDVGDEVKIGSHWAYVDAISLSNTVLKGFDGSTITLPNNKVWGGDIINFTHSDTRKIVIPIRIRFTEDIGRIGVFWKELVDAVPLVHKEPEPVIFAYAGSPIDYSVPVSLIAWANTDEFWEAYTEVLKLLQKRAESEGIELAAPQQEIHLTGLPPEAAKLLPVRG